MYTGWHYNYYNRPQSHPEKSQYLVQTVVERDCDYQLNNEVYNPHKILQPFSRWRGFHLSENSIVENLIADVNCERIREYYQEAEKYFVDYYSRVLLRHLKYYQRLLYVIPVGVVAKLRKPYVDYTKCAEGEGHDCWELFFGVTGVHDRQDCRYPLKHVERETYHIPVMLIVERLPPWASFSVIILNFEAVKCWYRYYWAKDYNRAKDEEHLEWLDSSDPC